MTDLDHPISFSSIYPCNLRCKSDVPTINVKDLRTWDFSYFLIIHFSIKKWNEHKHLYWRKNSRINIKKWVIFYFYFILCKFLSTALFMSYFMHYVTILWIINVYRKNLFHEKQTVESDQSIRKSIHSNCVTWFSGTHSFSGHQLACTRPECR